MRNNNDILDTRDLNKRLEELRDLHTAIEDARTTHLEAVEVLETHNASGVDEDADDDDKQAFIDTREELEESVEEAKSALDNATEDFDDDAKEELEVLEEMEGEISEWRHGETLVADHAFEDYARELAEDCGMISGSEGWPLNCIDWERAARELQMDYSTVGYQGTTYWYRSC
jgi:Antirestriction protein (ArdA)